MKQAILVRAPAAILAEPRTITAVIGRPPTRPQSRFPNPCAFSSRSLGATRFQGSILSMASRLNKV